MNSIIKTHYHANYDILKEFTESSGTLLYKGKPIGTGGSGGGDISAHEKLNINSLSGVHGIRFYNSKLQYYASSWIDIPLGINTITISPSLNNALVKYSNGYYVPAFLISGQPNNALVKYSDGYYVPKIPANMATTDDIDATKKEINDELAEQNQTFNERYNIITEKLKEVSANTTKNKIHQFSGINVNLLSVIDISTLYSLSSDVLLNLEFMIVNESDNDLLTIIINENDIETLNDTLEKQEVQRYKLPNIPNIEIFIQGQYTLYLYVTYI